MLQGKIEFIKDNFAESYQYFQKALEKSISNPRLQLTSYLWLIDCDLKQKNYEKAIKNWIKVKNSYKNELQFAYLSEAYDEIQGKILQLENEIIFFNAQEIFNGEMGVYEKVIKRMHDWLYQRAYLETNGKIGKMSKLLDKDEDTIKKWRNPNSEI